MTVGELIKKLQKLPEDATIGMIDVDDRRISPYISIYDKSDKLFCDYDGFISIKKIENSRHSNKDKTCDYYIY